MKHRGKSIFWGLLVVLMLVATACPQQAEEEPTPKGDQPTKGGVFNVEITEPASFDPPLAGTSEDIIVVVGLFKGLVDYDPKTSKVVPAVATKWESNADQTKWTFTLRKDAKFSNGEPVNAESFVRGWTRSTSKELFAEGLGYHLLGIKGAKEHSEGTAAGLAGVKAKDEYTLEVELVRADAEFFVRTGHTPFMPVPSEAAIAGQKPSWGEFPIGNGPFKLKEAWVHNQSVTLVRNDTYFGTEPYLDQVNFKILADPDAAYLEWQAGNLDWTRPPSAKTAEAKADTVHYREGTDSTAGTDFLMATLEKPPSNNKVFRQAVSMAIDRKKISDAVFGGVKKPATSIIPPSMPGYRPDVCKYCKYDVAEAKKLLEQSGVKPGTKIELWYNAKGGHKDWIDAVAQQLKDNLGLETVAVGRQDSFGVFLKAVRALNTGALVRFAWGMDYPTPDNFLFPLFGTGSSDNYNGFSSAKFDETINKAQAEPNQAKRIKLYQDAEDIMLDELSYIPIWYRTPVRLGRFEKFGGLNISFHEFPTYETAYVKGGAAKGGATTSPAASPSS